MSFLKAGLHYCDRLSTLSSTYARKIQFVLPGRGDKQQKQAFVNFAQRRTGRISVNIGYNDGLSHRSQRRHFFMPSPFEPCGLNQKYNQRYGTRRART